MGCQSYTLTYDEGVKGWPSFYSFFPEYIKGMNAYLYTFSGGNLFRHNVNPLRNTFYDNFTPSSITSVFNPEPSLSVKLFKTISFESNSEWSCESLVTDLSQGNVNTALPNIDFEQKEGEWYGYIRHNDGITNYALRYSNGIGTNTNVAGPNNALVVSFGVPIGNIITIGATVYTLTNGAAPVEAGVVDNLDRVNNTLTVDSSAASATAPVTGDFIMFVNNTLAESYGMRGYFMEFKLTNGSNAPVELFAVGSSVMKSFP